MRAPAPDHANHTCLIGSQPKTGRYAAWLVDLDGTLYRAAWVRLAMGLDLLARGQPALPVIRAFRKEQERLRRERDQEAACPYRLQIERTAERLGCGAEHVEQVIADWMHQRPGAWLRLFRRRRLLAEIRQFQADGGRTALVSDYPAATKLIALGAADLFEAVIANGEPGGPGRLKPWPDGYLLAAKQLGVAPQDCLVVGDRDDADGEAARRAGMAFRKISGLF